MLYFIRMDLTQFRVFTVFGIMTNILVTAMLLTGGAAVISSLTGMASSPDHPNLNQV